MVFNNWIFITLIYGCSIILIIDGLSITNDRESRKLFGGYKITPKFCNASRTLPPNDPRAHGPTICMFNHECTQRQGEVVGACMDGFLFGTCCQLHGSVETPLRPNTIKYSTTPKPTAAIMYEQYGGQHVSESSSNSGGGYYGNQNDDDLNDTNPSYSVSYDDAPPYNDNDGGLSIEEEHISPSSNYGEKNDVFLSTPKPTIFIPDEFDSLSSYFPISTTPSSPITKGEMYLPPSANAQQTFSVEIPSLLSQYGNDGDDFVQTDNKVSTELPLQPDFTAAGISHITNILTNDNLFSHSDITHPGPDTILVESNGQDGSQYGFIPPSSTASHLLLTSEKSGDTTDETTTPRVVKITYPKPQFKPRPTTEKPNKYILVHTISNDKQPTEIPAKPEATISENDIESIETIILQLNGTQQGGTQYETLNEKTGDQGGRPSSTYLYNSVTPSYGSTNFYVSNQLPGSDLITGGVSNGYYSSTNYAVPTVAPNKLPGSEFIAGVSNGYYPSTNFVVSSSAPTRRPVTSSDDDRFTLISSTSNTIRLPSSTLQPPSDSSASGRPTILISTMTPGDSSNDKQSTSYIFSSTPITRKPTTTKITVSTFSDEVVITPTTKKPTKKPGTKRPTRPTTTKTTTNTQTTNQVKISTSRPPSTSYVSSSAKPSKVTYISTTEKPSTGILVGSYGNDFVSSTERPNNNYSGNDGFVQISTITDEPHNPTVHITPKPTANLITQTSTWSNQPTMNHFTVTGLPDTGSSYIYQRPGIHFSTTPNYPPISNDFDDPGYFGVTVRPTIEHSISTTAIYHNIGSQDPILNSYGQPLNGGGSTYYRPNYGSTYGEPVYQSTSNYPVFNEQNELHHSTPGYPTFNNQNLDAQQSSPSDLNDFPPDRNPNIPIRNPKPETTTPAFTQDNVLDDKMSILVNKIVASLQDNFEGLADMLYERNETMIEIENLPDRTTAAPVKPSVITKKPVAVSTGAATNAAKPTGTKKPVTKKPATAKPLSDAVASSPLSSVVTKRPTVAATLKPVSSQGNTTKRPVTKVSTKPPVTTKKPTKIQATPSTVAVSTVTTKKPVRAGTTTKRPTTKPTRRTTTSQPITATEATEYEEGEEGEDVGQEIETQEENSSEASSRILCGVRPQMKSGRIVGGKSSEFGEWPWQVLVRESTWLGLFTKNKCGGVLISNNYVITAAHCQPGFLASLVAVFGEYDISGELESKRSVTKNVKNVIVHRNYDAATFENDLALLELESPVYYDTHIVPICMPSDEAEFTGRMATVSGWGRLKYGGGVPSVLQVVKVPILENNVCQEMFNTAGHNKKILPSFLCAGYANGQKDSCEGDSGGPLVLQRGDGRWELAGTVSHGIKCAAPYLPGVYMRTTFYKPWFESVTGVH